ncbi:nuclear transport factor 2 family protein [Chitinophaga vietnamensis]|uniref:nuclear transport factor 2 family protein n=1 Tax=Chitinophaga vietnamensis TaxID=2593957 RepID=UPI00117739DA|nr:nuclear transport factor 2 family protein [Chitinophaga vietnamensis]
MRSFCYTLFLLCCCAAAQAQTATDSVKLAVDKLFTAMRTGDTVALYASFTPDAVMQTIVTDKDGNTAVKSSPVSDFAARIGSLPKGAADERITFDMIRIDGPLASAWTPYQFYYQGRLHHCGANSFQLLRTNTGWKIQYVIDTRRKDGCVAR